MDKQKLPKPMTPDAYAALKILRRWFPKAADELSIDFGESFAHWMQTLDRKLLPRLDADFPMVAAICGGGSTGKSTLFNSLVGHTVSPTGGRAGLNRRVLVAIRESQEHQQELFDYLSLTFGEKPAALERQEQITSPGRPLFHESDTLPPRVVLLDTPDIDTGAKGHYANRDLARQSLEVADLFIYIFTNATYNNLDNTDFIARMITGVGTRPCYLVYRVYPNFSDEEVREHAHTVMENIYGSGSGQNVLGIFRVDEDNAVASGSKPMHLRSVQGHQETLAEALTALDPAPLRTRMLATMLDDAVDQASRMAVDVHGIRSDLGRYTQALETAQNRCVQNALSHFPTDRVLRRFSQIWLDTDPSHIKFMRNTGKVIEWPMKTVVKTVRRLKDPKKLKHPVSSEEKLSLQLEMDLLTAANQLYKASVEPTIAIGTQHLTVPAVVRGAQARLEQKPWQATLEVIAAKKEEVLKWSAQLDAELRSLANNLRQKMGIVDQIRQTFAAMLNVIPATAAITYILHTGDPVGAAGIKVKLTGLFGLHDLYALIAIPATASMSKADRKQLEQMLGPLARTWIANKLIVVRELFEENISGDVFNCIDDARSNADAIIHEIDRALADLDG